MFCAAVANREDDFEPAPMCWYVAGEPMMSHAIEEGNPHVLVQPALPHNHAPSHRRSGCCIASTRTEAEPTVPEARPVAPKRLTCVGLVMRVCVCVPGGSAPVCVSTTMVTMVGPRPADFAESGCTPRPRAGLLDSLAVVVTEATLEVTKFSAKVVAARGSFRPPTSLFIF